jgi:hypothetical protein
MKLPNGKLAIIPMDKLTGYCLNPNHPSGRHKAKVFASALGITIENATDLQTLIMQAVISGEVIQQASTEFGQLYKVDWEIPGHEETITLRTLWEIPHNTLNPRLISAFIK